VKYNDQKIYIGYLYLPKSVYRFTSYAYDPNNPVKNPVMYRVKIRKDKINEILTDDIVVTAYDLNNDTFMLSFSTTEAIAKDIEYAATELNKEYGGNYSDISKVSESSRGEITIGTYIINAFDLYDNIYDVVKGAYTFLFAYPPVPAPSP
jgi:hypothetical protein